MQDADRWVEQARLVFGRAVCHDILEFSARVVDSMAGQLW